MMKIIFVEDSSKISGVQNSTFYFIKWLKKEGYNGVKLFLPREGQFLELCKINNIKYFNYNAIAPISTAISFFNDKYRFPNLFSWIYNIFVIIYNFFKIKNKLKSDKPNIVITKGLYSHIYTGMACRFLKIKSICHLQDVITSRYRGFLIFLFNNFLNKNTNFIICDGQKIYDNFYDSLKKKAVVIFNGIEINNFKKSNKLGLRFRKSFGIPSKAYLIGNLSRITPWKGQLDLLEGFINYSKVNENAYLILAGAPLFDGNSYFNKIKKVILKKKLSDRVKIIGYITNIKEYLSSLDLYVHPSRTKDTSPLSLLSALAIGLPSIISKIESFNEIKNILPHIDQFNVGNKDELLKLFIKYEDKDIRRKIGKRNKEYSYKFFDISVHGRAFLNIIKNIN